MGILTFAKGFFPYKPFLPGLAEFEVDVVGPPKVFDKVVFMVVDALRRCVYALLYVCCFRRGCGGHC
jgi:ethanolaminephosphotransferase